MAYDICGKCERFFERNGKTYCEKCDNQLNISRNSIDEYLELNPRASIIEIVKETGVKLKDVNIFLERGGAVATSEISTINLRKEEISKDRDSLKMKNKFTPRSLGR